MLNGASSLPCLASSDRTTLAPRLLRRAVRQVALLRAASAGLAHAPTLDDRIGIAERVREDLMQLERTAHAYADLTNANLLTDAERCVADLSFPASWFEASIAQLLLCLAAQLELREQPRLAEPLEASERYALAGATEHLHAARAALYELDGTSPEARTLADQLIARWLRLALATLEDGGVRERYLRALAQELAPLGVSLGV